MKSQKRNFEMGLQVKLSFYTNLTKESMGFHNEIKENNKQFCNLDYLP